MASAERLMCVRAARAADALLVAQALQQHSAHTGLRHLGQFAQKVAACIQTVTVAMGQQATRSGLHRALRAAAFWARAGVLGYDCGACEAQHRLVVWRSLRRVRYSGCVVLAGAGVAIAAQLPREGRSSEVPCVLLWSALEVLAALVRHPPRTPGAHVCLLAATALRTVKLVMLCARITYYSTSMERFVANPMQWVPGYLLVGITESLQLRGHLPALAASCWAALNLALMWPQLSGPSLVTLCGCWLTVWGAPLLLDVWVRQQAIATGCVLCTAVAAPRSIDKCD
jgi:hypothetical protein